MVAPSPAPALLCDGSRSIVIDLLGIVAYLSVNRTRPASVRKDMHTGRVFCFQPLAYAGLACTRFAA